jgi:hypothetical protein
MAKESKNESEITIARPNIVTVNVGIVGSSPLIVHQWSEKAKEEMLAKQTKKAKGAKEAKDPDQQYRDSLYICDDGEYGFPSTGVKKAVVRGGTYIDQWMTFLRGAFHVIGEMIPIDGEPRMREDMVRLNGGKTADIRYRPEFPKWSSTVPVELNASVLSVEQLANLFYIGGFAVGIGEWRPERDGEFGRFTVDSVETVK